MTDKSNRKQVGIQIDPALWTALRKLAIDKGKSASDLIEEALKPYLAQQEGEKKP